ncbi:MAG TPA: phosphoadenylyl-sulfate reductase [Bacteroidales bacterium]|nr:phosphoadenylyl-sulfate reductase [Bacteroidales bacterium]
MKLKELREQLTGRSVEDSLSELVKQFPSQVIFTTSFGIEDQVLTHKIFSNNLNIKVVTLDTGRLFPETYEVFSQTVIKYKKTIHTYFPDYLSVEKLVTERGPFSFFESVEDRKECCRIRKVVPLNRALFGMKVWISGIRADQSDNRSNMESLEYDEDKKLFKYYPIFSWTYQDVKNYVKENSIPYNSLHDKGFVSIGCEPCTRAIEPGEDFRAGRWWWEKDGAKECGCHVK